ncbi:MAG TPA: S16 family serine protease [Candidatus Deferrimicrobium sp.]|nr:S16 family serine protease [Candidatus Deferrimicrobium sp.]
MPTKIIPARAALPVTAATPAETLPFLPLRLSVLFPGTFTTVTFSLPHDLSVLQSCISAGREVVASHCPISRTDPDVLHLHEVAVTARIHASVKMPDGSVAVMLEGCRRVAIERVIEDKANLQVSFHYLSDSASDNRLKLAAGEAVLEAVRELSAVNSAYSVEYLAALKSITDEPDRLVYQAVELIHVPLDEKQKILEITDVESRLDCLRSSLDACRLPRRNRASDSPVAHPGRAFAVDSTSRFSEDGEAGRIKELIAASPHLPPEVVARGTIEADRLGHLSSASAEYGATQIYLDWLLSLPWGKITPDNYDITEAEKILSSEYYGPENLKEQILQRLSVRKLQGSGGDNPTLCLIGAPGTGKASLARAIAHALGKELIRISVGGITDVAEIKGTPRTFISALPGRIMRSLREAGTCDPVVLIEEIDYFNLDNNASVNMALLEAIDARRNARFLDNYLGVPFDLSKVFFICSVRSFEEIPEQFLHRFEIIELPGYIEKEKVAISKRYLIPNLLASHGLTPQELTFSDQALARIISNYTQEAGLLAFSQMIGKIFRKIALEKLKRPDASWTIGESAVEAYLGPPLYIPERAESLPEIGTAAGLAWTGAGGELMFIEGLKMKGSGQIITTGSLGEVMKESIQAAHSYVRSKADMLGVDFSDFNDFDIHIHFPSGAIPKDGPSAGITVCLVIASVMSERPIRNDIAMTGEITLRGRVLPVAGIKEKISAAYRAGIYHVALPKENQKDIKELPKEIVRKTKLTFIERVDELFEVCLLDFTPSSYTLEKVFAAEIAKAKRKTDRRPVKRRVSQYKKK